MAAIIYTRRKGELDLSKVKVSDKQMEEVLLIMVEDACNNYINGVVNLLHIKNGTRKFVHVDRVERNALDNIWDAETFFCSDYGEGLTHQPGIRVMKALQERARKQYEQSVETGVNVHGQCGRVKSTKNKRRAS